MIKIASMRAISTILLVNAGVLFLLNSNPAPARADEITVFVAVSLTNAITDVASRFQEDTGNKARLSFNATSNLAKQIEAGAPADIFISADQEWMDYLAKKNLIDNATRTAAFGNSISLIASPDSPPLKIEKGFPLLKALNGGRLAVGDPDHTAIGAYAKASLKNLDVWSDVEDHLAKAASVRAGLTMVERGEAAMGIVFTTEGKLSNKVKILGMFPADTHPDIVYPMAIVANSSHVETSKKFIEYLSTSPRAREVFDKYGFAFLETKSK